MTIAHDAEPRIESPATPPEVHPGGADELPAEARIQLASCPATEDSGARLKARAPCTALKKSGAVCGRTVGVRDGLCAVHRAKPATAEVRSPVRSIRTPADALALASFAAVAAMEGRIPASRANSVANLCREWRRSHGTAAEAEMTAAANAFLEALAVEIQALGSRAPFMLAPAVVAAKERWSAALARWRAVAE